MSEIMAEVLTHFLCNETWLSYIYVGYHSSYSLEYACIYIGTRHMPLKHFNTYSPLQLYKYRPPANWPQVILLALYA